MRPTYPLSVLFVVLAGLIGWALHFTILYGGTTLACIPAVSRLPAVFQLGAVAFSIALLAGLAALAVRLWRRRRQGGAELGTFLSEGTRALAVISIVAIAWVTLPLLMLAECRG
jgi:hypothetical protein